ncbi:MAG: electron transfer flavoprotein subunit alpha/FixB family protein [Coriobacteriales bacterium]|jgi:electron transfer flavoprotein alpha subunit|nr:electron transfer flavoprotein subunit alpha/FixB family protein [Coriobacteriales bacterium]
MSALYVYSEKASLMSELVSLGKLLGKTTVALALSEQQAVDCSRCGASGIVVLKGDEQLPENNARAVATYLQEAGCSLFLVGATPTGRDLAARVAGYLDCGLASDISSIELTSRGVRASRIQYGGAVVLTETIPGMAVVTVPAGRNEPAQGEVPLIDERAVVPDTRVRYLKTSPIVKEGIDLTKARSIVGVGMGLAAKEDLTLVEGLAATLDAGIGCTRGIAEERHWLSTEQYLGLSGLSVAPDLYITVGISGQVQHLVGIRDSKVIVAIDKNENAPIFKAADYGIVGDLYEVIPLLRQGLE